MYADAELQCIIRSNHCTLGARWGRGGGHGEARPTPAHGSGLRGTSHRVASHLPPCREGPSETMPASWPQTSPCCQPPDLAMNCASAKSPLGLLKVVITVQWPQNFVKLATLLSLLLLHWYKIVFTENKICLSATMGHLRLTIGYLKATVVHSTAELSFTSK